jgi:hypothetical protein
VRIHIVVTNSGGKTLWEGMTSGSSTRFGRSYRAENYYETYSDALTVAASNLMQQPGFQAAVAHK